MVDEKIINNIISGLILKHNNFTIKCGPTIAEMKAKLSMFDEFEMRDIMRHIHTSDEVYNYRDYYNLTQRRQYREGYDEFKEAIEQSIARKGLPIMWLSRGYNSDDYESVDEFIEQTFPNILPSTDGKIYIGVAEDGHFVYTEEEYNNERFKYERKLLENMTDTEIAEWIANRYSYDPVKAMNRVEELNLTSPNWLIASANNVEVERVTALVGGEGEVFDHASHTNGIRELHEEASNDDGGLFSVVANSREDVERLADKVGATEIHHEDGDLYSIVVPYSID